MSVEARQGYAKGRAKRREILDQAMALFGEVGYRAASLREIAARCGISHPGLLHHFPTKQSLLLAVLEHRDEVDGRWLADVGDGAGAGTLARLVELVELNETRRGIVELFTVLSAEATAADHPARGYFEARYRDTRAAVERAYTLAGEAGLLRPGVDPREAARTLVALMDGLQIQWLLDGCRPAMAPTVRAHIQTHLTTPLPS